MKKFIALTVMAIGALIGVSAGTAHASAYPPSYPIVAVPGQVEAGTTFEIRLANLQSGATYGFYVRHHDGDLLPGAAYTAEGTPEGTATVVVKAPTEVGTYEIVVDGPGGVLGIETFHVVENPAATPAGTSSDGDNKGNSTSTTKSTTTSTTKSSGALPNTGTTSTGLILGCGLVIGGSTLVAVSRRRRSVA